ncbi:DUF3304 domain-containing protein, partial [Klebsiella pneumoniae]|uniref:DUF3304 domain-containing protein n=1 Tax=Klebsiella pneumoniae TaxID=573 RepID=UPI001F4A4395
MTSALISLLLAGLPLLTGCAQPAAQAGGGGGGTIKAINHTKWAICCFSVPARWTPGMTVRVDWETGVGSSAGFPGYEDEKKFLEWARNIKAQNRQHSKTVPLPDYNGQDV